MPASTAFHGAIGIPKGADCQRISLCPLPSYTLQTQPTAAGADEEVARNAGTVAAFFSSVVMSSSLHGSGCCRRLPAVTVLALQILATVACVVSGRLHPTLERPTETDVARLWQEPHDLGARNLYYGPGGHELMPDQATTFALIATDKTGYSPGYDVRGPDGMEWSVKIGPEAQPEVAVSRILWALGYHQPPTSNGELDDDGH